MELTTKVIARETLPCLIDNLVFPNLIYRETLGGPAAARGDTVTVSCPAKLTARDFDASSGVTPESLSENTVNVKLDKIATVDMQLSAFEAANDFASVKRQFLEPAAAALAARLNEDGLKLYKDIYNNAGTAGTTPSGLSDIADASYKLDMQKCGGKRNAVWNPAAVKALKQVPALVNAEKSGSTEALRNGSVGRVFGIDNYMSQAVCRHISTAAGVSVTAACTASNTVHLAVTSGAIVKGDLLKIGFTTVTVTDDPVAETGGYAVSVNPAVTATTSSTVTVTGSHTANLVFSPDAFLFVTRPLAAPGGVESYTTTYNGLSLRVVRGYDMKYKREILSMDVLYAFRTIRPELAVRYLG